MGTHRMIAASSMGEIQLIAAVERGKPERNRTDVIRLRFQAAGWTPTLKNNLIMCLNSVQFGTCSFLTWRRAVRLHMERFRNARFLQDRCYVSM